MTIDHRSIDENLAKISHSTQAHRDLDLSRLTTAAAAAATDTTTAAEPT